MFWRVVKVDALPDYRLDIEFFERHADSVFRG
jgi:hypothetical protein